MTRCRLPSFGALLLCVFTVAGHAAPIVRVLPNGMRVVVSPEGGTGRAGLVLMVRAGDADDPADAAGAARVLGRILAQPENHGAADRWADAFISGASWTVTEPDVTTFNVTTTPDQVEAAIRRLELTVSEPIWNRTLVMRSVREEAEAEHVEPPDAWTHDFAVWQARAGLPVAPLGIADPPDRDALKTLYRRLYTPDRMTLVVVGDIDAAAVARAARAAFTAPASPTARLAARRARPTAGEPAAPSGEYAFVGVAAPPAAAPDAAAVEVLAAALGLGKTSDLFQKLRERGGRGYESGVVYPRRLTDSGLALYVLAPGDAATMRDSLLTVWKSAGGPPKGGSGAARARAGHAYAAQHQTARDRAYWLAFWELSGQGAAHDAGFAARLRAVSDASLASATKRYLSMPPVSVP